jgi:hypothetical protein
MTRTSLLVVALGLVALACGGRGEGAAGPDQPASHGDDRAAAGDLAACTATVPEGATSCRLDLGTGVDTHWMDSDGVDPGTAGCHYEFTSAACGELKEGRTFGELCLDGDRLVESNPGPRECHRHRGDHGKPDVVSCAAWCQSRGSASGRCEAGIAASGDHGSCQSARCACDA